MIQTKNKAWSFMLVKNGRFGQMSPAPIEDVRAHFDSVTTAWNAARATNEDDKRAKPRGDCEYNDVTPTPMKGGPDL